MLKKYQKGITLIALVITVIILLILAGITISALRRDNGVVSETKRAKEETEINSEKEIVKMSTAEAIGKNKIANLEKTDLEKYLNKNAGKGETEVREEEDFFIVKFISSNRQYKVDQNGIVIQYDGTDGTGIKVGDYIDYQPETGPGNAAKTYSEENLVKNITGSTDNLEDITQENLKWQVLRIYQDGSMDLIGSPTNQYISFFDATGYNNGVNVMHDICEKLYSRPGITARSVTLGDMEKWLTTEGESAKSNDISSRIDGIATNNYISKVNANNKTVTYKEEASYYPNLYASENGAGINTETVKTDGMKVSDTVVKLDNSVRPEAYKQTNTLTTKQTYYYIPIDSTNYGEGSKALSTEGFYWVASRAVDCNSNGADFRLLVANANMDGDYMFYSNSDSSNNNYAYLRPVVTLGPKVKVKTSTTASSIDGTPHTITQY